MAITTTAITHNNRSTIRASLFDFWTDRYRRLHRSDRKLTTVSIYTISSFDRATSLQVLDQCRRTASWRNSIFRRAPRHSPSFTPNVNNTPNRDRSICSSSTASLSGRPFTIPSPVAAGLASIDRRIAAGQFCAAANGLSPVPPTCAAVIVLTTAHRCLCNVNARLDERAPGAQPRQQMPQAPVIIIIKSNSASAQVVDQRYCPRRQRSATRPPSVGQAHSVWASGQLDRDGSRSVPEAVTRIEMARG